MVYWIQVHANFSETAESVQNDCCDQKLKRFLRVALPLAFTQISLHVQPLRPCIDHFDGLTWWSIASNDSRSSLKDSEIHKWFIRRQFSKRKALSSVLTSLYCNSYGTRPSCNSRPPILWWTLDLRCVWTQELSLLYKGYSNWILDSGSGCLPHCAMSK